MLIFSFPSATVQGTKQWPDLFLFFAIYDLEKIQIPELLPSLELLNAVRSSVIFQKAVMMIGEMKQLILCPLKWCREEYLNMFL